jgi:hypothetical protein
MYIILFNNNTVDKFITPVTEKIFKKPNQNINNHYLNNMLVSLS